jgi:acetyl-CoA dehydrogenase-like protein
MLISLPCAPPGGARSERVNGKAKIATVRFYADHVLVQAPAQRNTVVNGSAGVMALSEEQFLAA